MSDSVRPHRRQPTRLPSPWGSPGKNTGVGCHFLLQCMKVKSESEVAQSCRTLRDPMACSQPGSSLHGIFQARVLGWVAIAFSGSSNIKSFNYLTWSCLKFKISKRNKGLHPPIHVIFSNQTSVRITQQRNQGQTLWQGSNVSKLYFWLDRGL